MQVPLVADSACRVAYGVASIDDSMLCAGEEGVDACQVCVATRILLKLCALIDTAQKSH